MRCEVDRCKTPSSKIIMGQCPELGTGLHEILMDTDMWWNICHNLLFKLNKSITKTLISLIPYDLLIIKNFIAFATLIIIVIL